MIKILERRELKRYQVKCDKCHSLLEYDCTDVKSEYVTSVYNSGNIYHIICPVCKHKITVSKP